MYFVQQPLLLLAIIFPKHMLWILIVCINIFTKKTQNISTFTLKESSKCSGAMENTSSSYGKHILQEANLFFLDNVDRTDNLNKIGMQENGLIFACLQSVSNYKQHSCMFKWPLPNDDITGFIQARLCKIQGLFKDIRRLSYCFQGLKVYSHFKILLRKSWSPLLKILV